MIEKSIYLKTLLNENNWQAVLFHFPLERKRLVWIISLSVMFETDNYDENMRNLLKALHAQLYSNRTS